MAVSLDRNVSYESLTQTLRAIDDETPLIATNSDRTRPGDDGLVPSTGCLVGAVEGMTGRTIDRVVGKPSTDMAEAALERVGVTPESCLVVGDRLNTDLRMGERAGMRTALVCSGVCDRTDLESSDVTPNYVLDSLADVETLL